MRAALFALLLVLLLSPQAGAGEKVRFKNGHTIVVEAVRVEGEIVYLTTSDGSEAGFPKSLVEMVEEGHEVKPSVYVGTAKSPRSPGLTELFGYDRAQRAAGRSTGMRMKGRISSSMAGQRLTAGFRYKGSVDVSEIAKEATRGPVRAVWDRSSGATNAPGTRPGPKTKAGSKASTAPALTPRVAPAKGKRVK